MAQNIDFERHDLSLILTTAIFIIVIFGLGFLLAKWGNNVWGWLVKQRS